MDDIADALDEMARLVVHHLADREGLSVTATTCLARLHREGALRLTALAAAERVSQPSMSQLVQRLQRQGYVTRVDDPSDGRASLVTLTDSGRALLEDRRQRRHERLAELLGALPESDKTALRLSMHVTLPLMRKLAAVAQEDRTIGGR
ncbi:MarR family winged helix-turn-helix transcriptional regulator [Amycolatopsis thermophila]|uniref:DNA-binding MarR family transcriptional regulator n=1 Tax=Amycolatopsis thermophila TaxID=206084 RepID=A0ABU0F597_9PSEU|nr:MarR family transcriptional regulator [Amycolatopsis thermophila]MDQ0382760.1 DNA-binding MarR family transcriptional regulator [Amycolatopsis thermophila]